KSANKYPSGPPSLDGLSPSTEVTLARHRASTGVEPGAPSNPPTPRSSPRLPGGRGLFMRHARVGAGRWGFGNPDNRNCNLRSAISLADTGRAQAPIGFKELKRALGLYRPSGGLG